MRREDVMVDLAIVGSTSFVNPLGERIAKDLIIEVVKAYRARIGWLISGGAQGVDSWAAMTGHALGVSVIEHLPRNKRWEPEGYKERNETIAQDCTHLLRISCAKSKTYGSGWTADRAQQLGKRVWRFVVPENGRAQTYFPFYNDRDLFVPCGATGDDAECACGCTAYEDACPRWNFGQCRTHFEVNTECRSATLTLPISEPSKLS